MTNPITSRAPMLHHLKCWVGFYQDVLDGKKPFEIRLNDRDYQVGDTLHLMEWSPDDKVYTDRSCNRVVTYITSWEQKPDHVVMGIKPESLPASEGKTPALDACVEVRPVAVPDLPDAHTTWFVVGNQSFPISDYHDTKADAEWYKQQFLHALRLLPSASGELTFADFRRANAARCVKWHPAGIASWSPSDWLTAVTGELGELASLLKMRNRERDGLPGNKFSPTQKQIADELADVLTYLDLLAEVLGVDLGRAAVEKFNEVSERVGFPDRIPAIDRKTT